MSEKVHERKRKIYIIWKTKITSTIHENLFIDRKVNTHKLQVLITRIRYTIVHT